MKKILAMVLVSCTALLGASMFASAETVPVDKYYVSTDSPALWEESNGCAGLQTAASECDANHAGDEAADTHIA